MFEKDVPNDLLYPECGCGTNYSLEDICKNPLDKDFSLPGYLEKQVLELTSQKMLSTYFRLKSDITENNVDGQSPNTSNNS